MPWLMASIHSLNGFHRLSIRTYKIRTKLVSFSLFSIFCRNQCKIRVGKIFGLYLKYFSLHYLRGSFQNDEAFFSNGPCLVLTWFVVCKCSSSIILYYVSLLYGENILCFLSTKSKWKGCRKVQKIHQIVKKRRIKNFRVVFFSHTFWIENFRASRTKSFRNENEHFHEYDFSRTCHKTSKICPRENLYK